VWIRLRQRSSSAEEAEITPVLRFPIFRRVRRMCASIACDAIIPTSKPARMGVRVKQKYLSPPSRGNMLYLPPGCDPALLRNAALPLIFTEGWQMAGAIPEGATEGAL